MVSDSVIVGVTSAIGTVAIIVPFLTWALGPRFQKIVVKAVEECDADVKEVLGVDKIHFELATITQSVTGLRGLVTTHDEKLKALGDIQPAMITLTKTLEKLADTVSRNLESMNDKMYDQGMKVANMSGLLGQQLENKNK